MSKKEAKKALKYLKGAKRYYLCPDCNTWHITSKDKPL